MRKLRPPKIIAVVGRSAHLDTDGQQQIRQRGRANDVERIPSSPQRPHEPLIAPRDVKTLLIFARNAERTTCERAHPDARIAEISVLADAGAFG